MKQPADSSSLAPHAAAAKERELLRERERLLREIQRKKRQLESAREKASSEAEAAVRLMAPLVQRHDALVRKLVLLFDELLLPGRSTSRARNQIGRFRRVLEMQGVLPPLADPEHAEPARADEDGQRERDEPSAPRPPKVGQRVAGADQVGQQRRSLRELFRSLARAVHPDQARQEDERARRTDIMKEVTRAYEDGDLARLIELENAWRSAQVIGQSTDPEARCSELLRLNRELLKQVRELTRQIRDIKREARDASSGVPAEELAAQASHELEELAAVYAVLRDFRDGKLSLADLLRDEPSRAPKRPRSRAAARRPW
jgi:hypothetical protein